MPGKHARVEPRGYLPAASVDQTDVRKATVRRFGRSDRSRVGQQVDGHAGFKSSRPDLKCKQLATFICGELLLFG